MAKMLREVYAPTKEGGTVLLKEGEDCPQDRDWETNSSHHNE